MSYDESFVGFEEVAGGGSKRPSMNREEFFKEADGGVKEIRFKGNVYEGPDDVTCSVYYAQHSDGSWWISPHGEVWHRYTMPCGERTFKNLFYKEYGVKWVVDPRKVPDSVVIGEGV